MSTTADHLSYQRARSVSLVGLGLQIVLALVLLIYGVQAQDGTAQAGSFVLFLGVPVWIALALVLHQHRLERLEELESAALTRETSVFGEGTESLVHAGRLAWMHKWFLPAVSLLLALLYIGVGFIGFRVAGARAAQTETFVPPDTAGWAIAIGVGLTVIGFVFARFAAGMGKQSVWMLLNTGAGVAISGALMGLLLATAHFL